jgi:hypothetical protein
MGETAPRQPEQPEDYLQQHPDAVADPAKAEVMARASNGQEGLVVEERGLALEAASHIGEGNRGYGHPEANAHVHAEAAELQRAKADQVAQAAGEVYERVNKV